MKLTQSQQSRSDEHQPGHRFDLQLLHFEHDLKMTFINTNILFPNKELVFLHICNSSYSFCILFLHQFFIFF